MILESKRMTTWIALTSAGMVAIGTLIVAATCVQAAESQRGAARMLGRHAGSSPAGVLQGLWQLDLSDAQWEQIRSIVEQNRDAMHATARNQREVRQAIQEAVTADVVNEGAIRALAIQLAAVEGDAAIQRAYLRAQVWQLLTAEQQVTAKAREAEAKERREQRRQRMEERREQLRQR